MSYLLSHTSLMKQAATALVSFFLAVASILSGVVLPYFSYNRKTGFYENYIWSAYYGIGPELLSYSRVIAIVAFFVIPFLQFALIFWILLRLRQLLNRQKSLYIAIIVCIFFSFFVRFHSAFVSVEFYKYFPSWSKNLFVAY